MTAEGVITLYPETTLEDFALKHWMNRSTIEVNDVQRCEQYYWLGSKLKLGHIIPKDQS